MEKTKRTKKTIMNIIVFILLIVLTFVLIFKDQDVSQILNAAAGAKKRYIFIGIIAMFIYIMCEAINIGRVLKEFKQKSTFLKNIKYTLIGFFFSSITPAASGGQPMEIYYMHKDEIPVAYSTLALMMQLCSFQIVTITMGIISAIIHFDVLQSGLIYLFILGITWGFAILGITLNSSALALLIIGIFSKKLSRGLINFALKTLKFFRVKNIEKKQEKMEKELASYQESAVYVKQHKKLMLKTVLTTVVQLLAYYSVPYWVYRALGFNTYNLWQVLTLQAVLYATVSGIPSPGAVGVSEGGFLGIFRNVFPEAMLSSAMLLSRGINFYSLILISAVIVIINTMRDKKTKVAGEG